MAERYVNYDKLLKERHRLGLDEMSMIHKVNAFNHFIDSLPTADVEEVKHGTWTLARSGRKVVCSCCETPAPFKKNETYHTLLRSNYCPNCGAKMDGGKTE